MKREYTDKHGNRRTVDVPEPPLRKDQREMLIEQSTMTLAAVTAISTGVKTDMNLLANTVKRVGTWGWIRDIIGAILGVLILLILVWHSFYAVNRPSCYIPNNDMVVFNGN